MSLHRSLRSGLVGAVVTAILATTVGTAVPAAAAPAGYTGPTHDQQAENTLKQLILDARKIEGTKVATVGGLEKAVKTYAPKAAWERGVPFSVKPYSLTFGEVSLFKAADGKLGLATRAFRGGCSMAVVSGNMSTTWTTYDLGKNCTGASAVQGENAGIEFSDPVAPAAPTKLDVVAGDGKATLSWTAPADKDIKSYEILVDGKVVATVDASVTEYVVGGLQNDTAYAFAVRAIDTAGNSSLQSGEAAGTPTDLTAPSCVTDLSVVPGDGVLALTWAGVSVSDLASYRVYMDGVLVATVPAGTTTLNVGGLENYLSYSFQVSAVDGHGNESKLCTEVAGMPVDLTAPDAVVGVVVRAADSSLNLTWEASPAADLGGYQVYVDGLLVAVVPAGTTSYTALGLENYTSYDVNVKAVDVAGNSSTTSETVAASPVDLTPAGVPADLRAVAGDSSATITWTGATDSDVASYNVYLNGVKVAAVPTGTTEYLVTGLENYLDYSLTVTSVDVNGNESAASAPSAVTPLDLTAPAVVTDFNAAAGDGQVTLSWTGNAEDDLAGYRIYQDGVLVATVEPGTTSTTVAGLRNYTPYSFTVTSFDIRDNESDTGAAIVASPVDLTPAPVPTGVAASVSDGSSVISWDSVAADDLSHYNVYVDGIRVESVPAGTTELTVGGLVNYTPYLVEVTTVDVNGNESDRSAQVTVTPIDLTAPDAVTGLAVEVQDSALAVSWETSTAGDLGGYRVLVDGEVVAELDSATTSYTVEDLSNGTSYNVEIVAFDVNGNSAPASPVSAAPADLTAPEAVTGITAKVQDSSLSLKWDASAAADLVGYRIFVDGVAVAEVPAGTTSYTVEGLENYESYNLDVVAFDEAENVSTRSTSPVSATPVDLTAPGAVTGLAVEVRDSALGLSWTASPAVDLGGYRVLVDGVVVATLPAGTTEYTAAGLTNDTSYTLEVVAFDVNGNSSAASSISAAPADLTAPGAITGLTVEAKDSSLLVKWDAATADDLAGYRVIVDGVTAATLPAGTTEYTVAGLVNDTSYTVDVVAFDGAGNASGPSVAPVSASPVDLTAPDAVTGITVTVADSGLLVSWAPSTSPDAAGYRVTLDGIAIVDLPLPTWSYLIPELTNDQQYQVDVVAVDAAGNASTPSASPIVAAPKDLTPPAVPVISCTPMDGQVVLSVIEPDLTTVGYVIYRDGVRLTTANGAPMAVASLVNGTQYSFQLAAVDAAGNESGRSTPVLCTPVDRTAPSLPTALNATPGDKQVSLSWSSTGESDLASYRIYKDGVFLSQVTARNAVVTGLTNGTRYGFTVTAVDFTGNESAPSQVAYATPVAPVPPAPVPSGTSTSTSTSISYSFALVPGAVDYKVTCVGGGQTVTATGPTSPITVTGLTPSTTYDCSVEANRDGYWSEPSFPMPTATSSPSIGSDAIIDAFAGVNGVSGTPSNGAVAKTSPLGRQLRDSAVAPDGTVYITEVDTTRVHKVTTDGKIALFKGIVSPAGIDVAPDGTVYVLQDSSTGGSSSLWKLNPQGVGGQIAFFSKSVSHLAVGPDGFVYVTSGLSNQVMKVSTAGGPVTVVAGTGTLFNGAAGFQNTGNPLTSTFMSPRGLDFAPDGSLLVIDQGGAVVRRVTSTGVTTVAGQVTSTGGNTQSENVPATGAYLQGLSDLTAGPDGSIYISESNMSRVRKFTVGGNITTIAGSGFAGQTGNGGLAALAGLGNNVKGLGLGPNGNLYLTSTDWTVRVVKPADQSAGAALSTPSSGTVSATSSSISYSFTAVPGATGYRVTCVNGAEVKIAGAATSPVVVTGLTQAASYACTLSYTTGTGWAPESAPILTTLPQPAITSSSVVSMPATLANWGYQFPSDIETGPDGRIWVSAGHSVYVMSATGTGFASFTGGFSNASGLGFAPDGTMYVADTGNNRVAKVTSNGTITTLVTTTSPVRDVAVGADGNVYYSSDDLRIRRVSASGGAATVVVSSGLAVAAHFEVAPDGQMYVSDRGSIKRLNTATGALTRIVGTEACTGTWAGGAALSASICPNGQGISFAPDGSLYIADGYGRIDRLDMSTGLLTAAMGDGTNGTTTGTVATAKTPNPHSVTVGKNGYVFYLSNYNIFMAKV